MLDKFFKISERGSTVSNEVIGGLTTFLAMAYIIAVNPAMMEAAGIPFNAALTATCFGAAIMTVAMGLFANRPIALASGMGINAIVAYSLCLGLGVDWRVAMAVVFLEGILILLTAVNLKGALLISIVAATIIGIPMGVTPPVTDFSFAPDFSAFAAPFQVTPEGTLAIAQVIVQPVLLLFVFSLLMSDFFDTMGTVVAVGSRAGFVDKKGDVEDVQPILIVDSAAAAAGGFIGASSITSFVESVSGAAAGARTGLSNIVIGIAFVACAFLAPVIGMVTSSATCGALVVVGYLMMTEIGEIDWSDIASAFPAFLTIVGIPMTYSIANGIGLGFISYCIIKVAQGKFRDVKPLMWVAALAFLASFIFA